MHRYIRATKIFIAFIREDRKLDTIQNKIDSNRKPFADDEHMQSYLDQCQSEVDERRKANENRIRALYGVSQDLTR
jgi:peptidoglycan hydrolase CwlO-like protein